MPRQLGHRGSKHRPFDLLCRDGALEGHVEVKGGTGEAAEIRLTIGENENARTPGWRTGLFVVHRIGVESGPDAPDGDCSDISFVEIGDLAPLRAHIGGPMRLYQLAYVG